MGGSHHRADSPWDFVQRLTWHAIVGAFVAMYSLAMVFPSMAQEHIPRGQPIPQNVRWVNATATGANTTASASMWQAATGNTTYHKVPVHVSAGTLGKLAKGALKRGLPVVGWGMAFRGIVDGAGWAIDELRQQVVSTPAEEPEPLGEVAYCKQQLVGVMRCASNPQRVVDLYELDNTNPEYVNWHFRTDRGRNEACALNAGGVRVICYDIVTVIRPTQGWGGYANGNQGTEAVPVSDADLGNLLKQNPQIVNAILVDPDTGAPIRTQELTDAMNNLRRSLEAANGLEPGSDMLPSDDYSQTQPSETSLPEFCAWATYVCDFIDWYKADDSEFKELPEHEIQIDPDSWSSGIGEGSCPAPLVTTWTFMSTPARFEFDYEPSCQFAQTMRPFLITCALICAAFIMAGLRSAGGKS